MVDDCYFCHKAQEMGYKVLCDPTLAVGYASNYIYAWRDYEAYKDSGVKEEEEGLRP